ncbi:uncharacterized protein LOC121779372 isoform X1 [Salvia splendens]|uniref:uncharacterized protein LOC121779372 isoform X1 n=2 Tax=Salvia splendens TaxID=180675 RepID=UPI001C26854E|nr:uncharacterized protein LOC121779372 isoform X1 [Salvia splendens]
MLETMIVYVRRERKKTVMVGDDPYASPILCTMRDPNNCSEINNMKVDDVINISEKLNNQTETRPKQPNIGCGHLQLMDGAATKTETRPKQHNIGCGHLPLMDGAATKTTKRKRVTAKAVHCRRYKDAMKALMKPHSSYMLLYEPHLVSKSKGSSKKNVTMTLKSTLQQSRPEKNPTKKEAQFRPFSQNVKTLTATGMLDGAAVQYLSASREKVLRGIIKGSSYLCGCNSCNYSKVVNAYEFECHAGCKTSHPNNHIHLENGKTLHSVVQELKNRPPTMLCDAIQAVIGPSLNRDAFNSWKESFEAIMRV